MVDDADTVWKIASHSTQHAIGPGVLGEIKLSGIAGGPWPAQLPKNLQPITRLDCRQMSIDRECGLARTRLPSATVAHAHGAHNESATISNAEGPQGTESRCWYATWRL